MPGDNAKSENAVGIDPLIAPTAAQPDSDLEIFQQSIPVRLIATPRRALATCRPDEPLSAVVERNRDDYDFFPVIESADEKPEPIVGLIELVPYRDGAQPFGFVREAMQPLSEHNLIGADASILDFIRGADKQRCRLVVAGSRIDGLVSLSDLQKLPVRAALFAMVTRLEIAMADVIRSEFSGSDRWMNRLSGDRQIKVREKISTAKSNDTYVDSLLFTEFGDKATIIRKNPKIGSDKKSCKREFNRVRELRDHLAHANDYAATPDAACEVCQTVRLMDDWITRLTAWRTDLAAVAD